MFDLRRLLALSTTAVCVAACGSLAVDAQQTPAFEVIEPPASVTTTSTSSTTTTTTTTIPPLTREDARVVVTSSGVVLPVRDVTPADWLVTTPCSSEARLAAGDFVGQVDVVIDPGHGGSESGAVGPAGLVEAQVNLDVSLRLEAWLAERGISSVLTRYADYRLPIVTRAEIVTAVGPKLFLSVHHNGAANLAAWPEPGTEVYVQFADDESRRAGELIYEELLDALTPLDASWQASGNAGVRYRLDGEGTDYYGVLRRTVGVPSVITEALFLSNGAEEALLTDPAVLDLQAEALGRAVERFLTTDDRGIGFVGGDTVTSAGSGTGGTRGCEDPPLE